MKRFFFFIVVLFLAFSSTGKSQSIDKEAFSVYDNPFFLGYVAHIGFDHAQFMSEFETEIRVKLPIGVANDLRIIAVQGPGMLQFHTETPFIVIRIREKIEYSDQRGQRVPIDLVTNKFVDGHLGTWGYQFYRIELLF